MTMDDAMALLLSGTTIVDGRVPLKVEVLRTEPEIYPAGGM